MISGQGAYWSLRTLLDRRPRLEINRQGIVNRTVWSTPVLVPWQDVREIRDTVWPGVREIVLVDPHAWLVDQPWAIRARTWYLRLFGYGPVPINLWSPAADWKGVDRHLQAAREAAELAPYRAVLHLPSDSNPGSD